ncbi:hypothetical protein BROUX41_000815 [Berkeleyomyces rouxiae]|uniref:uncharacterized protein n=1 Tax=Berkeleyomyces rouxiae TaxID=2035830 RepID=UPI003B7D0552
MATTIITTAALPAVEAAAVSSLLSSDGSSPLPSPSPSQPRSPQQARLHAYAPVHSPAPNQAPLCPAQTSPCMAKQPQLPPSLPTKATHGGPFLPTHTKPSGIELNDLSPHPAPALVPVINTGSPPKPAPASTPPAGSHFNANGSSPPGLGSRLKEGVLQVSSFTLSLVFLSTIAGVALLCHIPPAMQHLYDRLTTSNHEERGRPFYATENELHVKRCEDAENWARGMRTLPNDGFVPTEGGIDRIVCDVGYYARRVGLDTETIYVQTADGFILELWHVFDPRHHSPMPTEGSDPASASFAPSQSQRGDKYPVLLLHGLLQSSGTFCVNDDRSLAFSLAKAGYDVWLGNNRCGFHPRHASLNPGDSRMWAWDIREMATLDLPALVDGVLRRCGYATLGLVCHSQGTAQALLALSCDHVPALSQRISVVCALAPAAYAGPLVRKPCFRLMSSLAQPLWRIVFGVHSFVPPMMLAHRWMPARPYGALGYIVFSFLFGWSDCRWDRRLRARMFQFAPVHVSSALMWWWLGRGGFAHAGSILQHAAEDPDIPHTPEQTEANAWYPAGTPPMALWICGSDGLVDGEKLLERLTSAREPHANVVHAKVIPGYEHLDVLWAIDAPEQVNGEVARVLWQTCPVKEACVRPAGC